MGCYGLGLSRILASSVEYLSGELPENIEIRNNRKESDDLSQEHKIRNNIISLRWPKLIVPFKICIILPKKDSKESGLSKGTGFSLHLADVINQRFGEDILIDDRSNLTIGKRLLTVRAIGIPFVIVAGRNILDDIPKFEVFYPQDDKVFAQSGDDPLPSNDGVLMTQLELLNLIDKSLKSYKIM